MKLQEERILGKNKYKIPPGQASGRNGSILSWGGFERSEGEDRPSHRLITHRVIGGN